MKELSTQGPASSVLVQQELAIVRGRFGLSFLFLNPSMYCTHAVSARPLCVAFGGGGI